MRRSSQLDPQSSSKYIGVTNQSQTELGAAESEVIRPAFVSPDASVEATNTEQVTAAAFHKRSQSVALDPNDLQMH